VLGRAALITPGGALDVENASDGRFAADPQALYERWEEFLAWASDPPSEAGGAAPFPFNEADLLSPAPLPGQVFAVGLNYRAHASETNAALPERLSVFTKFPTCITGGFSEALLPAGGNVDWEVELVVVMGRRAHKVADWEAWSYVAGLAVGIDFSERILQMAAGRQFALGKSYPGFGPIGPWVVTVDELTEPDDLALSLAVNGETMQSSRTSDMVYGVPRIIEEIAEVVPLLPGDVIFTGTPAGVGMSRKPPRFLEHGDVVEATVQGVGTIRTKMLAP
jgi:2-keto-4-pentenoate hydratase/2-oxohepta-3-ene-1,7-dioic acid hydratase in catechol pathway